MNAEGTARTVIFCSIRKERLCQINLSWSPWAALHSRQSVCCTEIPCLGNNKNSCSAQNQEAFLWFFTRRTMLWSDSKVEFQAMVILMWESFSQNRKLVFQKTLPSPALQQSTVQCRCVDLCLLSGSWVCLGKPISLLCRDPDSVASLCSRKFVSDDHVWLGLETLCTMTCSRLT